MYVDPKDGFLLPWPALLRTILRMKKKERLKERGLSRETKRSIACIISNVM